jgi:hypothetical protein
LSLSEARENFKVLGACCERVRGQVRAVLQDEL